MLRILCFLGILILLSPILAISGWLIGAWWSNTHPESGENKSHVDWLPTSASNISYFKTYSYTAYEFNISEEDFIAWTDEENLIEISNPISIERFNFHETYFPSAENTTTVSNGLWWETPPRGNGGGTRIAFDRDTRTAYFQDNPR